MSKKEWEDRLLFALDGKYKELREQNHIDPDSVLTYEVASNTVEAVDLIELPLRYPCGPGKRWSLEDLGWVLQQKALLYRQSVIAHEISDEIETAEPTVGTVVLVITEDYRPYSRLTIKSRILPSS